MTKRVIDLTAEELDKLAGEAWSNAARDALAKGVAVTGREGDRIVKTYPDGRVEVLKEAAPLVAKGEDSKPGQVAGHKKRRTA
jgi:hypothetical protein